MNKHKDVKFSRLNEHGRLVPSHFGHGSFDAYLHEPRSLKNSASYMRQVIDVLASFRTSGSAWATGVTIAKVYNETHKPDVPKRVDSVVKVLSRLYAWGIVSYQEGSDRRGGFWALRADVDPKDGEGMLVRARSAIQIYEKLTAEPNEVRCCNMPRFAV